MIIVASTAAAVGIAIAGVVANRDDDTTSTSTAQTAASKETAADADFLEQQQKIAACRRDLGPLLRRLQNIDSRLAVGMNQDEYSNALGDVQVVYDRIDFDRTDIDCVTAVGVPAERAFNEYIRANTRWDNCIFDYSCDVETDVMSQIQEHWAKATQLLTRAERHLSNLGASIGSAA